MTDKALTKYDQFKISLRSDAVRERFEAILNERAEVFMSSLLSVVAGNSALQNCDTGSILTSAAKAAILNLPIEPSLGFAYIVPFKNDATFILGYKGYIQLAIRTSAYDAINATEIYVGEEIEENRLTGEISLDGNRTGDEVIGFAAYFRLNNGFEKFKYMTIDEIHAHAEKYSQSYGHPKSAWTTNFDDMGKKTVIRLLLSKYGLLSINMQDADISLIPDDGRLTEPEDIVVPDFGDIVEGEAVDAEPEPEQAKKGAKPKGNGNNEDEIYQAVVDAGLSENIHAAKNALKRCKTGFDTPEKAIAWMTFYRGWKDMGGTVAQAAKQANEGNKPK
jgi:recombination protein RecT